MYVFKPEKDVSMASCSRGWRKLSSDSKWTRLLPSDKKNLLTGLAAQECGGNGDCLFHVIASVLQHSFAGSVQFDQMNVRQYLSQRLTPAFLTDACITQLHGEYAQSIPMNTILNYIRDHHITTAQDNQAMMLADDAEAGAVVEIEFDYGSLYVSEQTASTIVDKQILSFLLDYDVDHDRKKLSTALQSYALTNDWEGDQWVLEQIATMPAFRGQYAFLPVVIENTTKQHPISIESFPDYRKMIEPRYVFLYNQRTTHWQLLGEKIEKKQKKKNKDDDDDKCPPYEVIFFDHNIPELFRLAMSKREDAFVVIPKEGIEMFGELVEYPKDCDFVGEGRASGKKRKASSEKEKGKGRKGKRQKTSSDDKNGKDEKEDSSGKNKSYPATLTIGSLCYKGSQLKLFQAAFRACEQLELFLGFGQEGKAREEKKKSSRHDDKGQGIDVRLKSKNKPLYGLMTEKAAEAKIDQYFISEHTDKTQVMDIINRLSQLLPVESSHSSGSSSKSKENQAHKIMFLLFWLRNQYVSQWRAMQSIKPDDYNPVVATDWQPQVNQVLGSTQIHDLGGLEVFPELGIDVHPLNGWFNVWLTSAVSKQAKIIAEWLDFVTAKGSEGIGTLPSAPWPEL